LVHADLLDSDSFFANENESDEEQPMNDLFRLVFDFTIVRRAIIFNYGWAIHVSPIDHLENIRREGLIANRDAGIPAELHPRPLPAHVTRQK
jgi:hypothetical protein